MMPVEWTPPNAECAPPKASEPAIHLAARTGDHSAIKGLAASNSDLNEGFDVSLDPDTPLEPLSPLEVAAGSGFGASVETLCLLVELGATLDADGIAWHTCYGLGWNYPPGGDSARLAFALEHGANPRLGEDDNLSILAAAASTGDPERVRLLLAHGASVNPTWSRARADERHRKLVEKLKSLRKVRPEPAELGSDSDGWLSQAPTGPNANEIPLFAGTESNNAEVVRALLGAGADVSARDAEMRTALFYCRSTEVAKLLTERGCDVQAQDEFEWTALDHAASQGNLEQVRALIAVGCDAAGSHDRGYTTFMMALRSNQNFEILDELVRAGADPAAITELGWSSLHAAAQSVGYKSASEAHLLCDYLQRYGVKIDLQDRFGHTPLVFAVREHNLGMASALLHRGADPNVRTQACRDGSCAIHGRPLVFAAVTQPEMLALLIDTGAQTNVYWDESGATALEYARQMLDEYAASKDSYSAKVRQALAQSIRILELAGDVKRRSE